MSPNTKTPHINTPDSTGLFTSYLSLDHQSINTQEAASKIQAAWRVFILRRDLPSNPNNPVKRNLNAEFDEVEHQQASTEPQFTDKISQFIRTDSPARKNRIGSSAPESSLPNPNSNEPSLLLMICQCTLISLGIISIYYVQKKVIINL